MLVAVPGRAYSTQGTGRGPQPQRLRVAGDHRRVRPDAAAIERGRTDRRDLVCGSEPRAFWGGYAASKAAFENLLLTYADETAHAGKLRVRIFDPGATRTRMRAETPFRRGTVHLKGPEVVAEAIVARLLSDAPTGERFKSNKGEDDRGGSCHRQTVINWLPNGSFHVLWRKRWRA